MVHLDFFFLLLQVSLMEFFSDWFIIVRVIWVLLLLLNNLLLLWLAVQQLWSTLTLLLSEFVMREKYLVWCTPGKTCTRPIVRVLINNLEPESFAGGLDILYILTHLSGAPVSASESSLHKDLSLITQEVSDVDVKLMWEIFYRPGSFQPFSSEW